MASDAARSTTITWRSSSVVTAMIVLGAGVIGGILPVDPRRNRVTATCRQDLRTWTRRVGLRPASAARRCLLLLVDDADLDRNRAPQPAWHVLAEPARDARRQRREDDLADIAASHGVADGGDGIAIANLTAGLYAAGAELHEEFLETGAGLAATVVLVPGHAVACRRSGRHDDVEGGDARLDTRGDRVSQGRARQRLVGNDEGCAHRTTSVLWRPARIVPPASTD